MGIREQGYRHWEGEYTGHGLRWWTIAKQGIKATVFNKFRLVALLLFTFAVWAPYVMAGLVSYFAGPSEAAFECGNRFLSPDVARTPDSALRCNLYDLLRGWQFLVAPPFIAMVACPLVSGDLRSNAMYIYLSKPLRRADYILGKLTAVAVWALPVTVLPNLFLWFMTLSSTNKFSRLQEPYEILFEILFVQLIFISLIVLLTLAVSSFTKNWQGAFLGILGGYFGLWIGANILVEFTRDRGWFYTNVIHNLVNFAQGVWDIRASPPGWAPSFLILVGLIGAAFVLFLWRILKLEVAE